MTERGAQLSIVGFWRPSMPPSPDATIIITILITERGRHYFFWDFGAPPPNAPPTQTPQYFDTNLTIYLDVRERGRQFLVRS